MRVRDLLKAIARKCGYTIERVNSKFDPSMEKEFIEIVKKCEGFTALQSIDRLYALYKSVRYAVENNLPGAFVECGVYKGGNPILMAYTLLALNAQDRFIYLYDTYEGMTEPTEKDIEMVTGRTAHQESERLGKKKFSEWANASLEEVRKNVFQTGYPKDKFIFIKGRVEETIPQNIPEQIAILRLDTDWYESTYHELLHLFPRLVRNGVLIIDDYGWWEGAKKATDQYLEENKVRILLTRLDYTGGRIGIKT